MKIGVDVLAALEESGCRPPTHLSRKDKADEYLCGVIERAVLNSEPVSDLISEFEELILILRQEGFFAEPGGFSPYVYPLTASAATNAEIALLKFKDASKMKTIKRSFIPSDRYKYDFDLCSVAKGWAQIDTSQDAHYYGQWVNPTERKTVCYCEGDVTECSFDTDAELVEEIEMIKKWNEENGHKFHGIDAGSRIDLNAACEVAGLKKFLH